RPRALFAPKALVAAAALWPERRDSIRAVLDSAYAGSPYTLALRGEPSPAFAAAEDSLARALGLTVARPTVLLASRVPPPVTGPRGPLLDGPPPSPAAPAALAPAARRAGPGPDERPRPRRPPSRPPPRASGRLARGRHAQRRRPREPRARRRARPRTALARRAPAAGPRDRECRRRHGGRLRRGDPGSRRPGGDHRIRAQRVLPEHERRRP